MLVQFSFSNYKCFKNQTTLNLTASNNKNSYNAIKTDHKYSVLKTMAVYGANASGKTKLFDALKFMREAVCPPMMDNSIPSFGYWQTKYDAFRLCTDCEAKESSFEIIFILDGVQYRYGFVLNGTSILSEWLYTKKQREANSFLRENGEITFTSHISDKIASSLINAKMISEQSLFLTVLKSFNEPLAVKIYEWISSIQVVSANDMYLDVDAIENEGTRKVILDFIKAFDIDIEDLKPHEIKVEQIPDKIKHIIGIENLKGHTIYDDVHTSHKLYNEYYEKVGYREFSLIKDESFGTNRLVRLSWPIINSLLNSSVLLIDEFDSGFHPLIMKYIIELFYRGKGHSQLIFNSQNSTLLDSKYEIDGEDKNRLLNKDQVYFVSKNRYGESELMAMTEFEGDLRSGIEKKFLEGYFGIGPSIDINLINI